MNYTQAQVREQAFYERLKQLIRQENGALINVGQLLYFSARRFPERIALIFQGKEISYRQLFNATAHFAALLAAKGVQPRDRVLLFFENSLEFFIGYYAIAQLGAVVVPLNTFLKQKELEHIIQDAQSRLMVTSSALLQRLHEENIQLTITVLTESEMRLDAPDSLTHFVPTHLDENEMAVLLYTSGTTGLPKGVMLSSKNCMINTIQGIARLGFVAQERVLGILPFFHSFAQNTCVWATLLMGCTVIIVPKIERRHILEGLTHNPTLVLGVPALFGLLCLMKTANLSSVRYFASGGDALPDKIRASFELIYQRKIAVGYGLSETSPVVCADIEDITEHTNNVGRPVIDDQLDLKDEQGNSVAPGAIGTIWVKGPNVMLGYYNAPDHTAQVIKDGWLDTGDLGYINERGKLIITGRSKDIIVNKGFKIYPQEIENVLLLHPNVLRAAVIGQPDPRVGQVAVAYVQLRKAQEGMEESLRELCQRNLADYKVPRRFICVTQALATTATGKVDKKKLASIDIS